MVGFTGHIEELMSTYRAGAHFGLEVFAWCPFLVHSFTITPDLVYCLILLGVYIPDFLLSALVFSRFVDHPFVHWGYLPRLWCFFLVRAWIISGSIQANMVWDTNAPLLCITWVMVSTRCCFGLLSNDVIIRAVVYIYIYINTGRARGQPLPWGIMSQECHSGARCRGAG